MKHFIIILLFVGGAFADTNAPALPPYSPTPEDWLLGGGDPSVIFGQKLLYAEPRTNAPIKIEVRPVLQFDAVVHEGYNTAFYGLYAADSLTNSWSSVQGWWADGSSVNHIEWGDSKSRFYILMTTQLYVIDTLPPTPEEMGLEPPEGPPTNSVPPIPGG